MTTTIKYDAIYGRGHYTCKFTVFCEGHYNIGYRTWEGTCPTQHRHKEGQHAYPWANVGKLSKIRLKIRCALHKVTTQERPVGGGKEGGYLISE